MSPCKCRPACGSHFGAAIAALGGAGGIPMRGSAAGRRRSPQPGRAAHRSMGDERERVRYMRRCGPRGADRRGGRGCVPGQPAGLREVVRGAPLRQGRPKGAGEPQAPVGCRDLPASCRDLNLEAASLLSLLSTSADALVQTSDDTIAASTLLRVVRGLIADRLLARRVGIAGGGGSHRGRERKGLPLASPMR